MTINRNVLLKFFYYSRGCKLKMRNNLNFLFYNDLFCTPSIEIILKEIEHIMYLIKIISNFF